MGFFGNQGHPDESCYTGAIASQKKDYRFKIGTIGEKKAAGLDCGGENGMSRLTLYRLVLNKIRMCEGRPDGRGSCCRTAYQHL